MSERVAGQRPRAALLRRRVKMSAVAGSAAATVRRPRRERLADRLAKLAELRRMEEAQAAPAYVVSDALPIDRLGLIATMLRPAPMPDLPSGEPISALRVASGAPSAAPAGADRDIVELMREFAAQAGPEPTATPLPPDVALPTPAALIEAVTAVASSSHDAPQSFVPPMPIDVPSPSAAVTPLPEAWPVAAPPAAVGDGGAGIAEMRPERAAEPPADPLRLTVTQAREPSLQPLDRAVAGRSAPPGISGWASFATGFAVALAFGTGLYVYLTG